MQLVRFKKKPRFPAPNSLQVIIELLSDLTEMSFATRQGEPQNVMVSTSSLEADKSHTPAVMLVGASKSEIWPGLGRLACRFTRNFLF